MILLVDLGNSRLKWACRAPGVWDTGAVSHRQRDMAQVLDEAWRGLAGPEKIVMASVAGADARSALETWTVRHWGVAPQGVTARSRQAGVINGYREPERLGPDRWAALIGARALTDRPACIVDCGTAVTVDALSADGVFVGGMIFPGLSLLRQGLAAGTAGLAASPGEAVPGCARSTADGIAAGTLFGLAGAVERLIRECRRVLDGPVQVFLTGGDAALLRAQLESPVIEVPDLVLKGLARLTEVP
jgi:type III pantothenate kinase